MKDKCTRCGGCCLTNPCFDVAFDEEVFIYINEKKIHKCKQFEIINVKAHCKSKVVLFEGVCTGRKEEYDFNLMELEKEFKWTIYSRL